MSNCEVPGARKFSCRNGRLVTGDGWEGRDGFESPAALLGGLAPTGLSPP